MPTYYTNDSVSIKDDQGLYIPIDTTNSDYQAYLAWVAEGNTIVTGPPINPPSSVIPVQPYGNIWTNVSSVFDSTTGALLTSNGQVLSEYPLGAAGTIPQSTGTGINWVANNAISFLPVMQDGRLTLSSNTPESGNVSSATTLYYTPYLGNRITLYNGTAWEIITFAQLSIAVPATTNTNYDVFIYNNAGTATLELTAWTSGTVRATALTTQDGVWVRTGALTRRYVGTVRTDSTSGRISHNTSTRHVWNMFNRVPANLLATFNNGEYIYTTAAWREAGGNITLGQTRVQWVCGMNTAVQFSNYSLISNPSSCYAAGGIALNRTNANDAQIYGGACSSDINPLMSFFDTIVVPGLHYAQRVEISQEIGTTTWYFSNTNFLAGLRGNLMC